MVWWLILGMLVFSDIASILLNILVATGLGISVTVVGAVVGIPLMLLAWGGGAFLLLNGILITSYYFWTNGVNLMGAKKLATMATSAIIEVLPLLSVLPTASISFVVVTVVENAERSSGILGAVAKHIPGK
jgi:hypothetical protein